MTTNQTLHIALTTLVILSVIMGAIAVPAVAASDDTQPATTGEKGPNAPTNADTNADMTTNTPVIDVTNTNTNAHNNTLENTNTNTNTNRANATANAGSTGSSLDVDGNGTNGTNGCTLPPPGTDSFEQLQKLLPDNDSAGDRFGQSVAIDRATETIVVVAPFDDTENGNNSGTVYVFTCQGDQFAETQKLIASDGATDDQFGFSVAFDGSTIVVGAPGDDNENGTDAGAAYVFERQNTQFVEMQKLTASDGDEFDSFGDSVAIDGSTIVVGAPDDNNENGTDAGAAYVFERQGGQFTETQKLIASDGTAFDQFGDSVAFDGSTIVVGAPEADNESGVNAGAAYVFERQGGQFAETQKLIASDGSGADFFGESVSIDGSTIVVGAPGNDNVDGLNVGAAYVFERQGGQFAETQKLIASDGAPLDHFGFSVAIDGSTIVVGAWGDDNDNGDDAGAAYVFERQGGQFAETQKLIADDGTAFDLFGLSVAIDGGSIVTGATGDDNENGTDAGAAYVFD